MGNNFSNLPQSTKDKLPIEEVHPQVVYIDGKRHERQLSVEEVPHIKSTDAAAVRAAPLEAAYSSRREAREQAIVFAEFHELNVREAKRFLRFGFFFFFFFFFLNNILFSTGRAFKMLLQQSCQSSSCLQTSY
jgi:hypothetical protein